MPWIELALAALAGLILLSLAGAAAPRLPSPAIYAASGILSLALALAGLAALVTRADAQLTLPLGLPWLGTLVRLDALSGFFLALIGLGGAAVSLYAIGYGRHEPEPQRVLPFYPGFLAAMALVTLAADAFSFLFAWEMMSLLSWALVMTHHHDPANRRAGVLYLVMAGFGTMVLLLAFGVLAGPDGSYSFEAMRALPRAPGLTAAILALVLIGTGSKAGLLPLHVWLPEAHPAAPSHVSALMSGVMTKVALYGFIRLTFDLLGPLPWWTSPVVILTGAITALMGILLALNDGDAKRVLAYSTIENLGVIFAALGLAMAFRTNHLDALAALAMTAALAHAFNHMAFKSLLFMGTGAVLNATGHRALDRLGGLIHRMPQTAALMLVGVVAISALPPLNGFVSEWLLLQSILQSPALPQPMLQFIAPAAGGMLALTAALAAAAFVRFYGIAFLSRPRSPEAEAAREIDRFSLAAMAALALLCALGGIFPGALLDLLAPAVQVATGARIPPQFGNAWATLVPVAHVPSSYSGLLVMAFVAFASATAAWLVHRLASRALRRGPAWDCGFAVSDPAFQYGGGSFAQPIRRVLGGVLLAEREQVIMPPPGDLSPARHSVSTQDLAWAHLYVPLTAAVEATAQRLNTLQFLTIRRYLSLVFVTLILLLVGVALWS